MIRFREMPRRPGSRIRRFAFTDGESGLSGEAFKIGVTLWRAAIPGMADAEGKTRLEACERVVRMAESGRG